MEKENRTIQAALRDRLQDDPDRRAYAFVNADGSHTWRTFQELYRKAMTHASVLIGNGLQPGDACVLVVPNSELSTTVLLAALLAGGRPLLVSPPVVRGLHSNLREVLRHVIRKTRAKVAFTEEGTNAFDDRLPLEFPSTRFLTGIKDLANGDPDKATPAFPEPGDVGALQLTSGTTGFPRVCVWPQERILNALDGMEAAMALTSDDVCVNWTPLYHDMGLVNNFLLCVVKGIPMAMLGTMDFLKSPAHWLRALADTEATVTWSPNFGFALATERIRDRQLEGVRLEGVRSFWNAAERVHLATYKAFHRRFENLGVRWESLKTNFGCAENVGGATFTDPKGTFPVEHLDPKTLHRKRIAVPQEAGSDTVPVVGVGRPYPGMAIKILSRKGKELPDGHIGEIAFDTPSAMIGYLGDKRETQRAFRGRYLLTGDQGYLRGDELFWMGRSRERINLHGKKYDPSDFEGALLGIDGLRPGCFAAFGVDDPELGTQRLVIVSEVRDGDAPPTKKLIGRIREEVAKQAGANVSDVVLLPRGSMSKTSSGKRRHRYYRRLYMDGALPSLDSLLEGSGRQAEPPGR